MIVRHSQAEVEKIRGAGEIVALALELARKVIGPGVRTSEIDERVEHLIRDKNGRPAFKGYRGFPASTCISINEEVVHGIPSRRRLESGQVVSVDVGVELDGYYGDAAATFAVDKVDEGAAGLISAAQEALQAGIEAARPGNHLNDISAAIENVALERGYSVVREYVGHGIGQKMHEEPQIPNYAQSGRGPKLEVGMVLALEPMLNKGSHEVEVKFDEWTVVTKDRQISAHYEHTVAITKSGPVVLTSL